MVSIENHIGKITVSEKFIAELVKHTVSGCFGVAGVCSVNSFFYAVSSVTGFSVPEKYRGVHISLNKDGGIVIDLHIKVVYGTNISAAVKSVVHAVSFNVEETVGIDVHEVNVFVDDMNY